MFRECFGCCLCTLYPCELPKLAWLSILKIAVSEKTILRMSSQISQVVRWENGHFFLTLMARLMNEKIIIRKQPREWFVRVWRERFLVECGRYTNVVSLHLRLRNCENGKIKTPRSG